MSELEQLRADLARVTAERNEALDRAADDSTARRLLLQQDTDLAALRARVAELETQLLGARGYTAMPAISTTAQMQAEVDTQRGRVLQLQQRIAELVEQLKAYGKYAHDTTLEDQNAELVAALKCVRDAPGSDQNATHRLRKIAPRRPRLRRKPMNDPEFTSWLLELVKDEWGMTEEEVIAWFKRGPE